ncbi:MAG: sugar phosphate isomerase/epimerase [Pseudomonadota bacterium]
MTKNNTTTAPSLRRRELFAGVASTTTLTALAALGSPGLAGASAHQEKPRGTERKTGIQLYTLRGAMGQDAQATLTALAGMGYANVEFAGHAGHDPKVLRGWIDDLGLVAPAGHVDPNEVRLDPGPAIEAAVTLGHEYIVIAWIPEEQRRTLDDYRRWADVLNRTGEAASTAGIRMAYHNHDFEFVKLDGMMPQQLLMTETDPGLVDFELDYYWVAKAGLDIAEVLNWAPERFTLAHIKDINAAGEIADVGTGLIDFSGLLASEGTAHLRYPFVEHDHPKDEFRSAAISHYGLTKALG